MKTFPADFRLPDWADYAIAVDMGVLRTSFDSGHARQRRRYTHMPHVFSITFSLHWHMLGRFQAWWNRYAYEWFEMPVPDMYASLDEKRCSPQIVRAIGDLQIRPSGRDHYQISTYMELSPAAFGTLPTDDCKWIIAGTPTAPAPDTFTGGTPAAPAANTVTAGTPRNPACHI